MVFVKAKTEFNYLDVMEENIMKYAKKGAVGMKDLEGKVRETQVAQSEKTQVVEEQLENLQAESVQSQVKVEGTPEVVINLVGASTPGSTPAFKYKKSGQWVNMLVLGSGLLVFMLILSFLNNLGLPFSVAGTGGGFFLILFIGDLIYFAPTLVYNASFGEKFLMFLVNSLFGFTIIGWIILLIIATSRNRAEKYKQEMLHHVKQK